MTGQHRCRFADVDEMAVVQALDGRRLTYRLTLGERLEVARILTARGRSAGSIGEYLGITERSVVRYRALLRTLRRAG